jgi:hypothetical protein
MAILVTYDVKVPFQGAVKKHALEAGFRDWVTASDGYTYRLPNTTLLVDADTPDAAIILLKNAAAMVSPLAKIEKVMAVRMNGASVDGDEKW